ncbi:MAG TPA: capsular biosynthesis protein [Rhodospirillaceae bacterium]|nr:capsular biosynthesis protein [Rhodospirillaceae bacterium]
MRVLIIDIDGTLCGPPPGRDYAACAPHPEVVSRLREYRAQGFRIVLSTSRNMRTFEGRVGEIVAKTVPTLIAWLDKHDIPYDEIHVGKPWCGHDGFYVDDRAVRPDEFARMDYTEIRALLGLDDTGTGGA